MRGLGKTRRDADAPATSIPLAYAFLALADDGAAADQRTLPRMLAAAAAAVVLAVGAPLGFLVVNPSDQPIGPLSSKSRAAPTMSDSTVAAPPPWEATGGRGPPGGCTRATSSRPGARCCAGSAAGAATRRCWSGTSTGSRCSWPRSCGPTRRPTRPRCATSSARRRCVARLAHPVVVRGFGAVLDGRFPHLVLEHLDGPDARRAARPATARWRSSSCCRSACTSPPRCTTWRPRASCTSTSSRATSSWAARRG